MSVEIITLIVNAAGWSLAVYLLKRWADNVGRDLKGLNDKIDEFVNKDDCNKTSGRLDHRDDEIYSKFERLTERVARIEGRAALDTGK